MESNAVKREKQWTRKDVRRIAHELGLFGWTVGITPNNVLQFNRKTLGKVVVFNIWTGGKMIVRGWELP